MPSRWGKQERHASDHSSVSVTSSKKEVSVSFFNLPPEIRIMVYKELKMTYHYTTLQIGTGWAFIKTRTIPLAILRTCRCINVEAYRVLKPRIYAIMILPPEIYIDTAQLPHVNAASADFKHFLRVLHRTAQNRETVTTLRNEKVAVPMSRTALMRWTRRSTPEMIWLRNTLLVPTQGKSLMTFFQQAELFLRGEYAWSLPVWRRLREICTPHLPPIAGLQIYIQDRNAEEIPRGLNTSGLILLAMFLDRFESFVDSTHGFETSIRAAGPVINLHTEEGGEPSLKRCRGMLRFVYQDGVDIRRLYELYALPDGQV